VEIRMLFTAIDKPQLQMPYAAAVLRVTGSTWTMVSGGGGSCSQGKGESVETLLLPKKDLAQKVTITPAAKSSAAANGSGSASSGGSARNSAASGNGNSAKLAANSSAGTGTVEGTAIGIIAVAFVAVVIGVIAWRRRRAAG
jgi:cobalamin biosynthesis Mg chelatase CobN